MPGVESPEGGVGVAAKLEHDGPTAVHHQVKPAVLSGHGEPFIGSISGDPHTYQSHPTEGDHLPSHHGRPAETNKYFINLGEIFENFAYLSQKHLKCKKS